MTTGSEPTFPNDITRLLESAREFTLSLGDTSVTSYHIVRTALELYPEPALDAFRKAGLSLPALACSSCTDPSTSITLHVVQPRAVEIAPALRAAVGRLVEKGAVDLAAFLHALVTSPCERLERYLCAIGSRNPSGPPRPGFASFAEYLVSAESVHRLRRDALRALPRADDTFATALRELERAASAHGLRARCARVPMPLGLATTERTDLARALLDELLLASLFAHERGGRGHSWTCQELLRAVLLDRYPFLGRPGMKALEEAKGEDIVELLDACGRGEAVLLGSVVRLTAVAEGDVLEALAEDPIHEADLAALRRRLRGEAE